MLWTIYLFVEREIEHRVREVNTVIREVKRDGYVMQINALLQRRVRRIGRVEGICVEVAMDLAGWYLFG